MSGVLDEPKLAHAYVNLYPSLEPSAPKAVLRCAT